MSKRAAIYVRVSSQEQKLHGLSVDNQIQALTDYCKEHGYTIVDLYNDAGISARKKYTKRPALLQLIDDCKNGLVDIILFTKLDRWFRSVGDYYEVQTQLDAAGVPWRAIWEDYETETSAGIFKVNIMLSVAQTEADRTSERIKAVLDFKKANGDYVGRVPFGYKRINGKLEIDEEKEPIVRAIFAKYLKTHSTRLCMDVPGFTNTIHVIRLILSNPAYAGMSICGPCPAYITQAEFDEIQEIRKRPVYAKTGRSYLFSSLAVCPYCGNHMKGTWVIPSGSTKRYYSYVCDGYTKSTARHKKLSISEKKLEAYMLNNVDSEIANYRKKYIDAPTVTANNASAELLNQKKKLEGQLERIGVRFELGDYTVDEYKTKRFAIFAEIKAIEKSLAALNVKEPPALPSNWKDMYNELPDDQKKSFWLGIIDTITIYRSGEKPPKITFK